MKKIIRLLCITVMFLFVLTGCGTDSKTQNDSNEDIAEPETVIMNEPEDIGSPMAVETPYGKLYYPEKYEESLTFVQEPVDNGLVVEVYGKVSDKEELLYMILYGIETENSFVYGTVTGQSGELTVSVEIADFIPDDSWQQEDADAMCAMQESVNYTMEMLKKESNFTGK